MSDAEVRVVGPAGIELMTVICAAESEMVGAIDVADPPPTSHVSTDLVN